MVPIIIRIDQLFRLIRCEQMGKFPEADLRLAQITICRKCKTRNKKDSAKCRNCGSPYLRPKRREIRAKK
jgi:ubiquitin-large subunit ribosomal protein L40e